MITPGKGKRRIRAGKGYSIRDSSTLRRFISLMKKDIK